jgi:alpha-L-fucosidase
MPEYMNDKWLKRQIEDIHDDNTELVFFEWWGELTHHCLDSMTMCYATPEDMDN